MKKVWNYLKHHIQEDFKIECYAAVAIFLIISLSLNYIFDFEDDYLELLTGYQKFLAYLLFYSFPYFSAVFIYAFFNKRRDILKSPIFWMKSIFGIFLLTLDSSLPYLNNAIDA